MTHEDDPTLPAHGAEGPLAELPRLRVVVGRMRPPAGAEAAIAVRLAHSVALPKRVKATARRRAFTFGAIVVVSVPGLVAAHPDTRHWVREFADTLAAVLPWSAHEAQSTGAAPADPTSPRVDTLGARPSAATAQFPTAATTPLPPAASSEPVQVAPRIDAALTMPVANASRMTPALNGRPELPSSGSPAAAVAAPSLPAAGDYPAIDDSKPSSNSSLARERELLERAQRLCVQGDPRAALALTDEHARQFPNGDLVPERLALRARAQSLLAGRTSNLGDGK